MKKMFIIAACAASFAGLVSCSDVEPSSMSEKNCTITLSMGGDIATITTKSSDTTDEVWDNLVSSVQYFVYTVDGETLTFYGKETETSSSKKSINCVPGSYKIYALVNGAPLAEPTVAQLESAAITLSANTKTKGFVMFGSNDVKIEEGNKNCLIPVKRHLSRINLVSVKNSTSKDGGDTIVVFKYAFLSNVVANQKNDGSATISAWDNLAGRKGGSIVTASNVDDGELTLYCPSSSVNIAVGETEPFGQKFYCYPNSTAEDSFGASAESGKTRLVVVCEVEGKDYYYPVTLDAPQRSTSYDVKLSILGIGSDDPNILVNKAGMTFSVDPWESGTEYTEEY